MRYTFSLISFVIIHIFMICCICGISEIWEISAIRTSNYNSDMKPRVKRVVDKPPMPKTTEAPLTSEELRERQSGTESPHLYDYPDAIYKSPEIRTGEWVKDQVPKKNSKNITKISTIKESTTRAPPPSTSSNNVLAAPLASLLGGLL